MEHTHRRAAGFLRAGHLGTLLTSLLYFDFCFAIWVLNAAMVLFIKEDLQLTAGQQALLVSVPTFAGALLRLPIGIVAQYIGRKVTAQLQMAVVIAGLLAGWLWADSYASLLVVGVLLGVAGASFGVALSLGAGWYPPEYKGLASGVAAAGNSGALFALLLGPPLARSLGWHAVYGLAAIPIAVAMVAMQIFAKEPPDREQKPLVDYLKVLVDRDAWVFNLLYMVTFGGYIGLTSFLPTLFNNQYHVDKASVGTYVAGAVVAASGLRVVGGWLADRFGGVRLLPVLFAGITAAALAAASLPASPIAMALVMILGFAAMGAGNGAVFQLVPLRYRTSTAVAGSLIGEIGALAGAAVPIIMAKGQGWQGTYAPGFGAIAALAVVAAGALLLVARPWSRTWAAVAAAPATAPAEVAAPAAKAA